MTWDQIEGNWKQFKGKVKQQWGRLTDDHLTTIAGKRDELAGRIQEAYGISKDEANRQINEWEASLPPGEPRVVSETTRTTTTRTTTRP